MRFHAVFTRCLAAVPLALMLLAVGAAAPASAHQAKVGDLVLNHPWCKASPMGAEYGAGYLEITNKGAAADKLVGGSTDVAEKIEIHEMTMEEGVMKMREVAGGLEIPAGATVKLAPGGYHIMFMGLKNPLEVGKYVKAKLKFEKAGEVEIELVTEPMGAKESTD